MSGTDGSIVLAAARAHRTVRGIYWVAAVMFIASLGFSLYRVASAVMAVPNVSTPEPEPAPLSGSPVGAEARETWQAPTLDITQSERAREIGIPVESAARPRGSINDTRSGMSGVVGSASAEDRARFHELVQSADRLLDREFDYSTAAEQYGQAATIPGLTFEAVDQALRGQVKANLFLVLTSGVSAVRSGPVRFVRYIPLEGVAATIPAFLATVPADQAWDAGTVRVRRFDTGDVVTINATTRYAARELTGDDLRVAKAGLLKATVFSQAEDAEPRDLMDAANLALRNGDMQLGESATGEPIRFIAAEFAHGLLSRAWDRCEARGASLSQTVQMYRDPRFQTFASLPPTVSRLEANLAGASSNEQRRALQAEIDAAHSLSDSLLDELVRTYPRAWEFRDSEAYDPASVIRREVTERDEQAAQRAEPGEAGDTPDGSGVTDAAIAEMIQRGRAALQRGLDLRDEWNNSRVRSQIEEAIGLFRTARALFEQAEAARPDNTEARDLATQARLELFWARKMMP